MFFVQQLHTVIRFTSTSKYWFVRTEGAATVVIRKTTAWRGWIETEAYWESCLAQAFSTCSFNITPDTSALTYTSDFTTFSMSIEGWRSGCSIQIIVWGKSLKGELRQTPCIHNHWGAMSISMFIFVYYVFDYQLSIILKRETHGRLWSWWYYVTKTPPLNENKHINQPIPIISPKLKTSSLATQS